MLPVSLKKSLKIIGASVLSLAIIGGIFLFGRYAWKLTTQSTEDYLSSIGFAGQEILKDIQNPNGSIMKEKEGFKISDSLRSFPVIRTADAKEPAPSDDDGKLDIVLPQNYDEPIKINLDGKKEITISHQDSAGFQAELVEKTTENPSQNPSGSIDPSLPPQIPQGKYTKYKNAFSQKEIYYSYSTRDSEKVLKNWILYKKPTSKEEESYKVENAVLRKNGAGEIEIYHFQFQDQQEPEEIGKIDQNLLVRAQLTVAEDARKSIEENGGIPDLIIPRPYYIDKNGNRTDLDWEIDQKENILRVSFQAKKEQYPIALDPTLSFSVATAQTSTYTMITGEGTTNYFGYFQSISTGDFNYDGKDDLVLGSYGHNANAGRVYIFYNDGSITTAAASADVVITGEASTAFGYSLASGDFNADGRIDLAVSGKNYSANAGRVYIFYAGSFSSSMTAASDANVYILGEASSNFGGSVRAGDINDDKKTDLIVGATNTDKCYIFYNDGSIPTTAATADVKFNGEASTQFGVETISGDFDYNGKTDIIIAGSNYSSATGRVYVFYGDGTNNFGTAACTGTSPTVCEATNADVIIVGQSSFSYFGWSMEAIDLDFDGRIDFAISQYGYGTSAGQVNIFYNDGSIPTTAAAADRIISGEATNNFFGFELTLGDFNYDRKPDLAVGAYKYNNTNTGRAYIFYGGEREEIPSSAGLAHVIISGPAANYGFGGGITAGDFDNDGRDDLTVSAYQFTTSTGRVYIFYSNNGVADHSRRIFEFHENREIGATLVAGDIDGNGKDDLVVGSTNYSGYRGRVYVFYNGISPSGSAGSADFIITGEQQSTSFGKSMVMGDFNGDSKIDLAVGGTEYNTNTGRVYIFYNDGSFPANASNADITITGENTDNFFGSFMTVGDFNGGGIDLAVGAFGYSTFTGRVYIFYNGSIVTENASTADIFITGESTWSGFGDSMAVADFNGGGALDLAVGAYLYSGGVGTGRVYIFYDSIITEGASTSDVKITGQTSSNFFGSSMVAADFNGGNADLAIGASGNTTSTGKVYIFYGDGTIPTTALTADVTITGEATDNFFGNSMTVGDFNGGGADLVVGANGYSTNTGRTYIFYYGSIVTENALNADIIITGEAEGNDFGNSMTVGNFSGGGNDLVIGATSYTGGSYAGRVYIFYNGSIVTENASGSDIKITGESAKEFGLSMTKGDYNHDGKMDLAVGLKNYNSNSGRVYIYYGNSDIPILTSPDIIITGENAGDIFGDSMESGDFNGDGKTDLVVGASGFSTNTGRVYIFYNGSIITENASGSDIKITGEAIDNFFGSSMTVGDFNGGGNDLAIGSYMYSTYTGRVYIFYNGSIVTENASGSDIKITGENMDDSFGSYLVAGDFNGGGTDLAVGAPGYLSNAFTGRVYIFYNGSIITENASGSDIKITGEGAGDKFGSSMAAGDFNGGGAVDLAIGAPGYYLGGNTGRVYIFYNGSIVTENASGSDIKIVGETSMFSSFGSSMAAGDFNGGGAVDLAIGGASYDSGVGRAYIFYNDGSIPTTAVMADIIIGGPETGILSGNYLGINMLSGDFNDDGKTDLALRSRYMDTDSVYFMFSLSKFEPPVGDARMRGNFKARGSARFR